jgi:hypothetical protein
MAKDIMFGLTLLYATFTSSWTAKASWLTMSVCLMDSLVAILHGWSRIGYTFLLTYMMTILGLVGASLILLGMFMVIYKLWLTLYRPF